MSFNPTGENPEPDYPYGVMVVYVLGVPYLGTTPLTEAEDAVPDLDEDLAAA